MFTQHTYPFANYEGQPKAGTVEAVAKIWIKDSAPKWKESTKCRYEEKLSIYILPHFGKREFSDISTVEIESFLSKIQTEGMPGRKPVSSGTARTVLTVMKQIRLHALKMDHKVRFNPDCVVVRTQKSEITAFSETDEKKLIAQLKLDTDETDAGFLVCLFTGIRIGELCALKSEDVDLSRNEIYIHETAHRVRNPKREEDGESKTIIVIEEIPRKKQIRRVTYPAI